MVFVVNIYYKDIIQYSRKNFLEKHLNKEVKFLPEVYKDGFLVGHTDDYVLVKCEGKKENLHTIIKTKIKQINYPYCIGEKNE